CAAMGPYFWGVLDLRIDTELLKLGKFAISRARGVFPDGSPFDIPERDPLPQVLDIPDNTSGETLYLCVPLKRQGALEVQRGSAPRSQQSRYRAMPVTVRDVT